MNKRRFRLTRARAVVIVFAINTACGAAFAWLFADSFLRWLAIAIAVTFPINFLLYLGMEIGEWVHYLPEK